MLAVGEKLPYGTMTRRVVSSRTTPGGRLPGAARRGATSLVQPMGGDADHELGRHAAREGRREVLLSEVDAGGPGGPGHVCTVVHDEHPARPAHPGPDLQREGEGLAGRPRLGPEL